MKLIDKISPEMIHHFDNWEATEQIIDDKKAFWCIKKPGSEYQKVCLYRDGCNMFVYGDYGQFTFDSMTWLGTVHNLEYDNFGYQMEKLNRDSKDTLLIYDEYQCREDIYEWLKNRLEDRYDYTDDTIGEILDWFEIEWDFLTPDYDIEKFCEDNNYLDIEDLLLFVNEALHNTDECEWVSFLRRTDFSNFDEECESDLWRAGRCVHQRYYICMYALQKCSEKLIDET